MKKLFFWKIIVVSLAVSGTALFGMDQYNLLGRLAEGSTIEDVTCGSPFFPVEWSGKLEKFIVKEIKGQEQNCKVINQMLETNQELKNTIVNNAKDLPVGKKESIFLYSDGERDGFLCPPKGFVPNKKIRDKSHRLVIEYGKCNISRTSPLHPLIYFGGGSIIVILIGFLLYSKFR